MSVEVRTIMSAYPVIYIILGAVLLRGENRGRRMQRRGPTTVSSAPKVRGEAGRIKLRVKFTSAFSCVRILRRSTDLNFWNVSAPKAHGNMTGCSRGASKWNRT
ncbi:hypothetical protein B0H19DRAFT_1061796 [Mycena capillaripes]|nr:hypothetical protein B0H19DRAFT_1061796 [Mycena capillaripes]